MKKTIFLILLFIITTISFAQVGIGTTTPNTSSALDVVSSTKGFLIPRMSTADRTGISTSLSTDGLQVYDTTTHSIWYYKHSITNWVELSGSTSPIVAFGKVNLDGSAAKIHGATVTRNSVGNYTVTFLSALSSADYIIQLSILDSNGLGHDDYDISYSNQEADSFVVKIGDNDNGASPATPIDQEFMFTIID